MIDIPKSGSLLKRCLDGEELAYKELYERYSRAMYNIAMRILNEQTEAEDVIQEAFMNAFTNLGQLKSEDAFGSWLKRIVVNRSVDRVRRRKSWYVEADESIPADDTGYEEPAEYDPEKVRAALAMLPEGYRVIVTLFLFEDLPHKSIAEKLGISESTSKSQYARGRKKLASFIMQLHNAR